MTGQLENRVAIVTGAGRGIGRAIALGYAGEGAAVAAVARSERELASLEKEISEFGGRSLSLLADVAEPAAAARVVARTVEVMGGVDILVNNAGVGSSADPRPVAEFDDGFWNYTLAVNLTAPYRFSKAVLAHFQRQKRGRIVNIASIAGKIGLLHGAAYSASKHGLLGLTRSLALELARDGITVNAICPGPVRTRMNELRVQYDAERSGISVEQLESHITPIGRRLAPEEIVPLAVLLASDASAAITGQAFNVDGGLVMSG